MSESEGKTQRRGEGFRPNGHKLPDLEAIFRANPAGANPVRADPAAIDISAAEIMGEELPFDLEAAQRALTPLQAEIPQDAFTAPLLGVERAGGGIVIGAGGLILTIGYLIVEAESVAVLDADDRPTEAEVLAYDFESGLGLARAVAPLGRPALRFGALSDLEAGAHVVTACGGSETIIQTISGKRPFHGYWEYALEEAVFTTPAHPNWGGAAMIGMDGLLYGVGSLYVEEAGADGEKQPGNMIVPVDLLTPVMENLIRQGRRPGPARPWLGVFVDERQGHVIILGTAPGGPAETAGIQPGDIILRLNREAVGGLADFYRRLWSSGPAGGDITLTVMRQDVGAGFDIQFASADRNRFLKPSPGRE